MHPGRALRVLTICFFAGLAALMARPAAAEVPRALVDALGAGDFAATERAVEALAATGDPAAVPALEALAEGDLSVASDGRVLIVRGKGPTQRTTDPLTGEDVEDAGKLTKIKVNNKLRRGIRSALGALTLQNPDRAARLQAAASVFKSRDTSVLEALDQALTAEQDPEVRTAFAGARAAIVLFSDAADAEKLAAVEVVRQIGGRDALDLLKAAAASAEAPPVLDAIARAIGGIERSAAWWSALQNAIYGISLGSVLLLAAIGLAITFGVMGVINMAHGEMVMIGAYTTFVVQEVIRSSAPWLFDWSLLIALPLAFAVAGLIGIAIERGIIRFLYGRPLETLLATWGLSLVLQQAVRTVFGPTNRLVGSPSWMSGSFQVGELTITFGRLWILVFGVVVFFALLAVLRRTMLGLKMRAVTQNRAMAASMGIRTPWVDALTFGLGSGIAGLAGVALSQIDNVSPNLGQGYIIDSFMIVIFGGVGNLWGTLVGAMTLGVVNKFLEPFAGAVLGKIFVLVFIILFIQVRPRGLFAPKGRAVEA